MNNNVILGLQGLKKMLKGMFFLAVSLMVVCADGKQMGARNRQGDQQVNRSQDAALVPNTSQQTVAQGQPVVSQQPIQQSVQGVNTPMPVSVAQTQFDENQRLQRLQAAVNWVLTQSNWPTDYVNTFSSDPLLTEDQKILLTNHYNTLMKDKASNLRPYISTKDQTIGESQKQEESSLVNQAWEGAKERVASTAGWGWQKGKQAYEYATSVPGAVWRYGSSLGTGTKVAGGATAIAAVPYLGAAATGGTALAAGAAGYGLLSLLDRLEFRYQSGHWSRDTALKFEAMRLQELLSDSVKYPTPTLKINFLEDKLESPTPASLSGDEYNISRDTRQALKNKLMKELENPDVRKFDDAINNAIGTVRLNYGYNPNDFNLIRNPQEKIKYLETYATNIENSVTLDQIIAVLSEYYRTRNKIEALKKLNQIKPAD